MSATLNEQAVLKLTPPWVTVITCKPAVSVNDRGVARSLHPSGGSEPDLAGTEATMSNVIVIYVAGRDFTELISYGAETGSRNTGLHRNWLARRRVSTLPALSISEVWGACAGHVWRLAWSHRGGHAGRDLAPGAGLGSAQSVGLRALVRIGVGTARRCGASP